MNAKKPKVDVYVLWCSVLVLLGYALLWALSETLLGHLWAAPLLFLAIFAFWEVARACWRLVRHGQPPTFPWSRE